MPRNKIESTFTPRTKVSTVITSNRTDKYETYLWVESNLPWKNTFFPWLYEYIIPAEWNTPRYWGLVTDLSWNFVTDTAWGQVLSLQGDDTARIITKWK